MVQYGEQHDKAVALIDSEAVEFASQLAKDDEPERGNSVETTMCI